jgi:hypothetical protein
MKNKNRIKRMVMTQVKSMYKSNSKQNLTVDRDPTKDMSSAREQDAFSVINTVLRILNSHSLPHIPTFQVGKFTKFTPFFPF